METIQQVPKWVNSLLTECVEQKERSSGFVQRESKMNGSRFVQTLVWSLMQDPDATLEGMAGGAGLVGAEISAQGLAERFTPAACELMHSVLTSAMGMIVTSDPVAIPLLARFRGVYLLDSTVIPLPSILHTIWPGASTNQGEPTAALKVQVRLDYRSGCLDHVALQSARSQDRAAPVQHAELPAGSIRLADAGYFSLPVLRTYHDAGVYFLTRAAIQTQIITVDGEVMSQADFIHRYGQNGRIDQAIRLGKQELLPCRIVAWRVGAESAQRRKRKLKNQARKQQRPLNPDSWTLADWAVFVTNVPSTMLNVEEVTVLSRVRWQIELLFKRWKSYVALERSRSQNHWRILCEVYAKLLVVLIQHWFLLATCWSLPDRSLAKATIALRKFVVSLALLLHEPRAFQQLLTRIGVCIAKNCRLNKRHKNPSTAQLLMQFA